MPSPISLTSRTKTGYKNRSTSVSSPRPALGNRPRVAVLNAKGVKPNSTRTDTVHTSKKPVLRRSDSAFHFGCCSVQPRFRALLFGLTYEGPAAKAAGLTELTACHNDAHAFAKLLRTVYSWKDGDIMIMTDSKENIGTELWPCKKNMEKKMRDLVDGSRAGDVFVLFYAGHSGQVVATVDKNEVDGKDEHMISADGHFILDDDLRKMLVEPLHKGTRLTAVFDSCHSGTLLDLGLYRTISRMSDVTQDSTSKAPPVVGIVMRADSMPNPKSSPLTTAAKCATKAPLIALQAVVRFTGAAMRTQSARILRMPIPSITFSPAPEVSSPVEVTLDDASRSEVSSVLTEQHTESTASAARKEDQSPPHIPERVHTTSIRACKHCRFLANQSPVVISIAACMDNQQAGEDMKKKNGFMTPALIELLQDNPHLSSRDIQAQLQPKMFDTCCKAVLERKNSLQRRKKPKKSKLQRRLRRFVEALSWQVIQFGSEDDNHMDEAFLMSAKRKGG